MSSCFVSKIWLYRLLKPEHCIGQAESRTGSVKLCFIMAFLTSEHQSIGQTLSNPCFHRSCVTLVAEPIMLQHYALYCTFYCQSMLMLICDAWYNHFLWSGRQSVELRVRHSEIISGCFQSQLFCQWSTGYWSSSFTWSAWSAQSQCQ